MTGPRRTTDRGLDRLVNFSDAVVAIAITLLVLPLVDLAAGDQSSGAGELIAENYGSFIAFLMTFAVTTLFWFRHHSIFELVADYDDALMWLNALWLLGIVLLPFTSDLINPNGFNDGAGLLYCGTMAFLSAMQALMVMHVRRNQRLWAGDAQGEDFHARWSWIYALYFTWVALVSLWQPGLASFLMLGLIVLGRLRAHVSKSAAEP